MHVFEHALVTFVARRFPLDRSCGTVGQYGILFESKGNSIDRDVIETLEL